MTLSDDRKLWPEGHNLTVLVGGTDPWMSGWGKATAGKSYAFWACRPENANTVEQWVKRRGDIKRVRVVGSKYRPSGRGHCHIYTVDCNHPALRGNQ